MLPLSSVDSPRLGARLITSWIIVVLVIVTYLLLQVKKKKNTTGIKGKKSENGFYCMLTWVQKGFYEFWDFCQVFKNLIILTSHIKQ